MLPIREAAKAKEAHKAKLLTKPNVVGVGVGFRERGGAITDELCVLALVARKIPRAGLHPDDMIPSDVDGIQTDVIEVGVVRALQARTNRWRPAPGGVTIGHYKTTAGTLSTVVRDGDTGERLILSNNHVLANSNEAAIGDPILQPGPFDGGLEEKDAIATLRRYKVINFMVEPADCALARAAAWLANLMAKVSGSSHRLKAYRSKEQATNRIDAALARPLADNLVVDEILEIGVVGGSMEPFLGMKVRKSGRTTGLTTGEVRVLESTIDVEYGSRMARFEGQILTTPMSEPGDSGSLLVAADELSAVGLLFAGSQQATVFNPIQDVLSILRVKI